MREYQFSVEAGAQSPRTVSGAFVRVKSADAEINVKVENESGRVLADLNLSEGMRFAVPEQFKKIRVKNNNASAVAAVLVIGVGDVDDARLSGQLDLAKAATITSAADVAIAATSTAIIKAANLSRIEVMITNLSTNTASFRIGDAAAGAAKGVELLPGATITLTTTAAVYGYNSHTAAQSLAVLEVLE